RLDDLAVRLLQAEPGDWTTGFLQKLQADPGEGPRALEVGMRRRLDALMCLQRLLLWSGSASDPVADAAMEALSSARRAIWGPEVDAILQRDRQELQRSSEARCASQAVWRRWQRAVRAWEAVRSFGGDPNREDLSDPADKERYVALIVELGRVL